MPQPEPEPVPSLTASPTRTTLHGSVLRGSADALLAGSRALASSPRLWPVKLADLTVIVPTRNEAPNIDPLLRELRDVGPAAVLFVDDSDDQTPQVIRRRSTMQVRLMHREPGERAGGLGTAVAMGMDACTTRFCAVMDGDLQHPPAVLADLHHALAAGADLAIASRYAGRGAMRASVAPCVAPSPVPATRSRAWPSPPSHAAHADPDTSKSGTCAEVRLGFKDGIVLEKKGRDPLGLDRDGNGVACSVRD